MTKNTTNTKLVALVGTAIMAATAFVLMLLEFPILPAAPYLKMDFSDIPCVFAGLVWGPGAGVAAELLKNLLEMLVKGIGTQMGFGNLQNFIVGCSFVLPFTILCRTKKIAKPVWRLVAGSMAAVVMMIVVGFFSNLAVAPLFFRFFLNNPLGTGEALAAAWVSVPFNAIKGTAVAVASSLLYLPIKRSLG